MTQNKHSDRVERTEQWRDIKMRVMAVKTSKEA